MQYVKGEDQGRGVFGIHVLVQLMLRSGGTHRSDTMLKEVLLLINHPNRHTFTLSRQQKQDIWNSIEKLLADNQVEVREHATGVLAGLMKGGDEDLSRAFRERSYASASLILKKRKIRNSRSDKSIALIHGAVLALTASVLSVPYDMPCWLPDHVTLLAQFFGEPSPIKSTVTKAVAEFRRTHADAWNIHKDSFTEEQLEVLADTSASASYFA